MKRFFIPFVFLFSMIIISCQKEIGFGSVNNGGSGSNDGRLLVKLIAKSGSDSTISTLGYNSNNKLISMNSKGVAGGMAFDLRQTFIRNSQGIITHTITKSPEFSQLGVDSVITVVQYNTASGRYTGRVTKYDFLGVEIKDSLGFTYDANGKITMEEDFTDPGLGSYARSSKNEYTYSGNNLASIKVSTYDANTAAYVVQYIQTLNYDNKTSPLILDNEAFAIASPNWYSSNNAIKSVSVVPGNPSLNETQDVTYTYNSFNKPASAITVVQGGPTANLSFIYN